MRLLTFILCCVSSISFGQQPACLDTAPEKATIQSLLIEVRQLRLAVERSASAMPRMQLLLTRFQLQQERVDQLARELKDFRSMMAANLSNKESMAAQIRDLESQAQLDPAQRNRVEAMKKALTSQLEQQGVHEQEERQQELELSTRFRVEQTKRDDLSDQLNSLDKRLQSGQ
jgi:hypothetical protein